MGATAPTKRSMLQIAADAEDLPPRQLAYVSLRDGILAGRLPVATVLDTTLLANDLGISRTPVREALQQLLQEGLVERGQRRQMVVRRIPYHQRHEIFLMREALECAVIRHATRTLSTDQFDDLRALLYRQRRARVESDAERFIELDERFHLSLAATGGLPMFRKVLSELRAFIRIMGNDALRHPGRMDAVVVEHETMLEALERRDARGASRAMRNHLAKTEEVLQRADPVDVGELSGSRASAGDGTGHFKEMRASGRDRGVRVRGTYE